MNSKGKYRKVIFYKDYFQNFFVRQRSKVRDKIIWTLELIEDIPRVPEIYLKHLENTEGLYEIRVQQGSDIFRIFCFFDQGNLVVLANGFNKKPKRLQKKKLNGQLKLKKSMKTKESRVMTLNEFKDKHYGKRGTVKREELESGYDSFKIGALIHEARIEKGMTQEQLAEKVGTTKSYISKIENNLKEVRLSTLKKIVETGLGGQLQLSIKLK